MGISIGGGKSSGSSQANLTPEQKAALAAQTEALTGTLLPAYKKTLGMADTAFGQVNPAATTVAQTAMDVGQQAGALQQDIGTGAYQQGAQGTGNMAQYQQGLGKGLTGVGAGGAMQGAGGMLGLGQTSSNTGITGASNVAYNQAQVGQALQNQGAAGLASLFDPQYKKEQISAAMQPAREDIREQLSGQNAMFGGAGGLGSSRMALANRNMSQLGEQRLATAAATASGNVEAQRQAAANALMGAGQGALGQAGTAYGNIFGTGAGLMGQGTGAYGQLLGAGQGASTAAQTGYGAQSALGQAGLTGAQQAASSRIGYAQTPQDVLSKYASVIYGTPQASTTPNFAGTQGQSGSSKGFGTGGLMGK